MECNSIRNHTSDGMVWYGMVWYTLFKSLKHASPKHTAGFHGGRVLYKKRRSAGSLLRTHILWARHGGRLRDQPKECVGGYAAGVRFLKSSMIIDRIGRHEVLLTIHHKNINF